MYPMSNNLKHSLSCVHYTIISVVKLDLFTGALLLDRVLALEETTRTPSVHLVMYKYVYNIQIFKTQLYFSTVIILFF